MIHKLTIKNFFSYGSETILDFRVGMKAPETSAYLDSAFDTRLNSVMILFGANASGKTNLLRALGMLRDWIVNSFDTPITKREIPVPNLLAQKNGRHSDTQIIVQFEFENTLFEYSSAFSFEQVQLEELRAKVIGTGNRFRRIFQRKLNVNDNTFTVSTNQNLPNELCIRIPKGFKALEQRTEASFISICTQISDPVSEKIHSYWENMRHNLYGGLVRHKERNSFDRIFSIAEYFYTHKDELEFLKKHMNSFCLGIDDLKIEKKIRKDENGTEANQYAAFGVHSLQRGKFNLHLAFESAGTINILYSLMDISSVLLSGGVAIIDELDSDIHPLNVPKLVDLFMDSDINCHNAQLIATCHSAPVMNHLDKYQIILVEKNYDQESELFRLDDLSSVRSDENYFAKYMAGAYGAVPGN